MTLSYIPADTNDEGILKATASGTMPNGKPVVVNTDGTVSSIAIGSDAVTTPVAYNSSTTKNMRSALDTSTGNIMILYGDNVYYLVMATISGSSVSFGTPTLLSGNRLGDISYDVASGHFLLVYQGASNYGRAQVASLSGTNITVSTELVWASNITSRPVLSYDPVRARHMCVYMNEGTNNLKARVFRITGTTPSAGVESSVNSGANICSSIAYNPDYNSHLVCYQDYPNSQEGKCNILKVTSGTDYMTATSQNKLVFASEGLKNGGGLLNARDGTQTVYDTVNDTYVISYVNLSGILKIMTAKQTGSTTITFGSPSSIASSSGGVNNYFEAGGAFDPNSGKVIVTYNKGGTSGRITTAKVSGSSVGSFSTTTFESAEVLYFTTTFNPDSGSALTFYRDGGNSNYGTYVLFTPGASNLTSENYIGMSTGGTYASGSTATVKIIGNTSDEQTSLTAGQSYFVQTDGTIGTTAANPSVFAGTAISDTRLIIKT